MRGFFQRNPGVFTYMLVGTNPNCVEQAILVENENPLFASIPCQYVPSFDIDQVRQMVKKLGSYVGLQFDELICSKLAEDFGGHPFLIRQACSLIHVECKGERPITVDKALYEKVKEKFIDNLSDYLNMIVQVLKDWYPDEYDMLKYLAQGDMESFLGFAQNNSVFTKHLIGYGLVQYSPNGYAFNIELLRNFLLISHKYVRINLSEDEKVEEVSRRRNSLEKQLRVVIKNALKLTNGKRAQEKIIASLPENRREKHQQQSLDELLSRDNSPLFLLDLIAIINREWDSSFKNIFDMDKKKLSLMLEEINSMGRPDAHAKFINVDDFSQLRLYFNKLESILNEWA